MKYSLSIRKVVLMVVLGFLAFAGVPEILAEQRSNSPYWIPPAATENAVKTDEILLVIFWLTTAVFVGTQVVFIYYLVRYRRKKGEKAVYSHGNNRLEVIWTAIPAGIFLWLAIWSDHVWFQITSTPVPKDAITVELVGYQFAFDLRYAGADGVLDEVALEKMGGTENRFGLVREDFDMTDDFTSTELVIPEGKPVHILLRSRDVIHSFYVPEFRLYQDMVPGRTIDWMWFRATRKGNYELACNQLCGSGHYNMKAPIKVVSQEEYDKWHAAKIKSRGEQIAALAAEKAAVAPTRVVAN